MARPAADDRVPARAHAPWLERYVLLSAIWGTSFLFIKVADRQLAPLQVVLARVALGAATVLVVLLMRRERLPTGKRTWGHLAFLAVVSNAVPFSLIAYGEQHISSVLAGLWNATTPLFTLLIAVVVLPDERPTPRRLGGLLLGFVGVAIVLGPWSGLGGPSLEGSLAVAGASACYGLSFVYIRRFVSAQPDTRVSLVAGQLICGTAIMIVATALFTSPPAHLGAEAVLSVVALGALGTGVAYVLNYSIVDRAGATIASTVTYLIPLFATACGVAILGEGLSWNEPVGALVVLGGVALAQRGLTPNAGTLRRAVAAAPGALGRRRRAELPIQDI
ncbi:MAG TPA: DMT family transporter [Solirubrobacteraceae bacterium]|jgi:drug/metabolite transporter (DMT)-like permease|nr:DMT family transporter [Solirubrobacteraceae bacterium]